MSYCVLIVLCNARVITPQLVILYVASNIFVGEIQRMDIFLHKYHFCICATSIYSPCGPYINAAGDEGRVWLKCGLIPRGNNPHLTPM